MNLVELFLLVNLQVDRLLLCILFLDFSNQAKQPGVETNSWQPFSESANSGRALFSNVQIVVWRSGLHNHVERNGVTFLVVEFVKHVRLLVVLECLHWTDCHEGVYVAQQSNSL